MLDARNIYRKATRKIYDFSPEQMRNLSAIIWLYRDQNHRFTGLVQYYFTRICSENDEVQGVLAPFDATLSDLQGIFKVFTATVTKIADIGEDEKRSLSISEKELLEAVTQYNSEADAVLKKLASFNKKYGKNPPSTNRGQHTARDVFEPHAKLLRSIIKQIDTVYRSAAAMASMCSDISLPMGKIDKEEDYNRRGTASS